MTRSNDLYCSGENGDTLIPKLIADFISFLFRAVNVTNAERNLPFYWIAYPQIKKKGRKWISKDYLKETSESILNGKNKTD